VEIWPWTRLEGVLSPQESFEPAILNRCGWVFLNIWGLPRRQHGFLPQNSEKVPSSVFSLPLSAQCQFLRYGLPAAGCPPQFAFSSSTWRGLSRSVPSSTHDPANPVEGCSAIESLAIIWPAILFRRPLPTASDKLIASLASSVVADNEAGAYKTCHFKIQISLLVVGPSIVAQAVTEEAG